MIGVAVVDLCATGHIVPVLPAQRPASEGGPYGAWVRRL
jgi:hypothetical protein